MESITNTAKAVSATQDEEVRLELIFYRDRKHKDEVGAKMLQGWEYKKLLLIKSKILN